MLFIGRNGCLNFSAFAFKDFSHLNIEPESVIPRCEPFSQKFSDWIILLIEKHIGMVKIL
jgi:hypothetical protein